MLFVKNVLTFPEIALFVSALLFTIGLAGLLFRRKSLISILMSLELMLLAVSTNFIAFSAQQSNTYGWCFVFFILTVAAVESATGLAILILVFRQHHSVLVEKLNQLKG